MAGKYCHAVLLLKSKFIYVYLSVKWPYEMRVLLGSTLLI